MNDIERIRWKPPRRPGWTIDDYVAEGMVIAEKAFAAHAKASRAEPPAALEPPTIEHDPTEGRTP